MNILLTGGTGLIGKALIHQLIKHHEVWVLTRDKKKASSILPPQCHLIDKLTELDTQSIDSVINLAGEPIVAKRWTSKQKSIIKDSRWETTLALSDWISRSEHPPSTFISGSAIGYYGRQGDQHINESFPDIHQEFSHVLCKKWEDIALNTQTSQTRVCVLRTGIVLANQGGALEKMLPPFKLGLGGPIGNGNHYMAWIHIDDMVNAILFLLNTPQHQGVFNLTAPNPETNKHFSQILAKLLHRPCLLPMPKAVLKVLLGEMSDLLIFGQRVIPERLVQAGFEFDFPTLELALDNILNHSTQ